MTSAETVRLAWHHLDAQVPAEWEVVGYKKNPADGRLVLADRHGEALQAHWKVVKGRPLVRRTLENFVASAPGVRFEEKEIRQRMTRFAGWDVFLPSEADRPAFAARFHEPQKALLNFAFPPHPDTADRKLVRRVLASWRPNDGADRAWAAFGLEFSLPKEWPLTAVTALPARQEMEFENKREETIVIRRFGMSPLVLGDGDEAAFFARVKGKKFLLHRLGAFRKDDRFDGVVLSYTTRGTGLLDSLLARARQGRVWVWRCDAIKRLFAVEQHALEKDLIQNLYERVVCR